MTREERQGDVLEGEDQRPVDSSECMKMRKTGWDLGPFSVVLHCLHLDKHLLEQQNQKEI